ncbi:GTPase [Aquipuribacter sp. MA13-6]|uniref:GTPase n=1 Tax=unclassified Aquipuribacter TaxID=2635084 RepID=UPI003EF07EA0
MNGATPTDDDTTTRRGRLRRGDRKQRTPEVDPAVEVPDLISRIDDALTVAGDRFDPDLVEAARAEIARTGVRAGLGTQHTVVALAGATGSGKSSLFNSVAGFQISTVGVRRPTTSHPVACVWGEGADPLLDWLEVPSRHRTVHDSELGRGGGSALEGLVLLDMPDHDSRETAHRMDVDRLVDRIDLIVWVVDPQKYADETLHADYLRRLRGHDDVLLVVLNQADRLTPEDRDAVLADLQRLVREDGLPRATVMATSTVTGEGVEDLRGLFADAVASRAMALGRARAALRETAAGLRRGVADDEPGIDEVGGDDRLTDALAGAASVPAVVSAVESSYRRDASAYIGWPLTRWVSRLRRDPLKRLRLEDPRLSGDLTGLARSSVPEPTRAQLARVDLAERQLLGTATEGLPERWAESVRQAPVRTDDLRDALDQAVLSTDLTFKRPAWWVLVGFLHVVLAAAALVGLLGLLALFVLDFLQVPYPDLPTVPGLPAWLPLPLPTALTVIGLLGGALLTLLAGTFVPGRARARAETAQLRLEVAVGKVARERVLVPVADVLADHRRCRDLLTP